MMDSITRLGPKNSSTSWRMSWSKILSAVVNRVVSTRSLSAGLWVSLMAAIVLVARFMPSKANDELSIGTMTPSATTKAFTVAAHCRRCVDQNHIEVGKDWFYLAPERSSRLTFFASSSSSASMSIELGRRCKCGRISTR